MATFFLVCAVLGGSVLVLQLALGLAGVGLDHDGDHPHGLADGFDFLSVRALAAVTAFLGVAGRWAMATGMSPALATLLAVIAGGVAGAGVVFAMRLLRRFESDGVVRIERALGQPATVHVRVPADGGVGKVTLTLHDRFVELAAVSLDGELPTGTPVTVVGVAGPDTLEVVRTPETGV